MCDLLTSHISPLFIPIDLGSTAPHVSFRIAKLMTTSCPQRRNRRLGVSVVRAIYIHALADKYRQTLPESFRYSSPPARSSCMQNRVTHALSYPLLFLGAVILCGNDRATAPQSTHHCCSPASSQPSTYTPLPVHPQCRFCSSTQRGVSPGCCSSTTLLGRTNRTHCVR